MSRIFSAVMWTGKAATFCLGLAVALALAMAITTGVAEAAKSSSLKSGVQNAVRATTSMVGAVAGPVLRLDNDGSGAALDLQVEPGNAPMSVNSDGRVTNLNADTLDGQDASAFMSASTYRVDKPITADVVFSTAVSCDPGDLALSGAWANKDAGTEVTTATPGRTDSQSVGFLIDSDSPLLDDMTLIAVCADLPPLR